MSSLDRKRSLKYPYHNKWKRGEGMCGEGRCGGGVRTEDK